MNSLADCFSNMHQLNLDFNQRSTFGKNIVQEKIFFTLRNTFACWAEITSNQIENIDLRFNKFFNYWNSETQVLKEVIIVANLLACKDKKYNLLRILQNENGAQRKKEQDF